MGVLVLTLTALNPGKLVFTNLTVSGKVKP